MLTELAQLALNAGSIDEAETRAREALALADRIRDRSGRVFGVGLFARLAVEERNSSAPAVCGARSSTRMSVRPSVGGGATVTGAKNAYEKPQVPNSSAVTPRATP